MADTTPAPDAVSTAADDLPLSPGEHLGMAKAHNEAAAAHIASAAGHIAGAQDNADADDDTGGSGGATDSGSDDDASGRSFPFPASAQRSYGFTPGSVNARTASAMRGRS